MPDHDHVVELSVEETNRLRAELGMAPLRLSDQPQQPTSAAAAAVGTNTDTDTNNEKKEDAPNAGGKEVLELSVDDTNNLRAKLGLPALRTTTSGRKEAVHKPAENDQEARDAAERIQQAKLKRDVQQGASETFGSTTLAAEEGVDKSALSWAERMRQQKDATDNKKKKSSKESDREQTAIAADYEEKDLDGLQVAHNMADLETGETTVLTLADAPLLQTRDDTSKKVVGLNDGDVALENVQLTEHKKQQDGLRKKRMLEMGMGRAGGYAGFDDDEFEELGGTLGPARTERGSNALLDGMEDDEDISKPSRGFRIGGTTDTKGEASLTDLDKIQQGKAVSLVPAQADVAASDYMTLEEEEVERAKRKMKKDGTFKKKKKKKKKDKKRRKTHLESDDEEDNDEMPDAPKSKSGNILDQLEETAALESSGLRKRRRADDEDDDDDENITEESPAMIKQENGSSNQQSKRSKYDEIMAKGNDRTKQAFAEKAKSKPTEGSVLDDEPDDSFLNAALAKARRLNRLRELNKAKSKGADAVAESVKSMFQNHSASTASTGGISFAIDDTREFTLALQARAQQKEREAEKAKQQKVGANVVVVKKEDTPATADAVKEESIVETVEYEDVDMEELAKEMQPDEAGGMELDGSTAKSSGVGRGLSSFVSMLKTTGEITGKNSGKEELRGRAKDERNYEHYSPMDLSQVVKIGRNATGKDLEMANREVKLEYRDKHGRLLTTKEAYRDLCYQFHGNGGNKKKEDKRLKLIERENAQARMASRQVEAARDGTVAGTLGALRATQKATGKAFIVHKT